MLMYVLESNGSSPGRQGFFMAINGQGAMVGSVGGGIMEHKFVELAKAKLRDEVFDASLHRQVHDKEVAQNQSGMICSGEQTIFLYIIQLKDAGPVRELVSSLQSQQKGFLVLSSHGVLFSTIPYAYQNGLSRSRNGDWIYVEPTGYQHHLYIVGGGHCSLSLSHIMSKLGFCIHVFDTRTALNTMEGNNYTHYRILLDDYQHLADVIPGGESSYVVIMTFGYRTDYVALKVLLAKNFQYIGMLGSNTKIEKMFATYRSEGVPEVQLSKVHAPIGINIKSETPEEIAISIAAQIIRVKNTSYEPQRNE